MPTHFATFLTALAASPEPVEEFGETYLVIPPVERWEDYWCEPRNVLTFACQGVDGVHYAIVKIAGEVRDDSPVIHISPTDSDQPYCVLAATFLEYLAVACDVTTQHMADMFEQEGQGQRVLLAFLQSHFNNSRLYVETRLRSLDHFLKLVEAQETMEVSPWSRETT